MNLKCCVLNGLQYPILLRRQVALGFENLEGVSQKMFILFLKIKAITTVSSIRL